MGQDECAVTACVARPSQLISLAVTLPVPGTRLQMGVAKAPVCNGKTVSFTHQLWQNETLIKETSLRDCPHS